MIHIALFEPEIPPNTGNIIRLAANTGCQLHLIEPLGFSLEDKKLRRAGLDYHEFNKVHTYKNWSDFLRRFLQRKSGPNLDVRRRLFAISTRGKEIYSSVKFQEGDVLLFGPETRGLPESILNSLAGNQVLRLPMLPQSRSLNLSNAAAVVVYEAWRQQNFEFNGRYPDKG